MIDPQEHISVLMQESLEALDIQAHGHYFDGTFGRGGHSRAILERLGPEGRLWVCDKDPQAIALAQQWAEQDPRIDVFHGSFVDALARIPSASLHAAFLDLGVSSPQLDEGERGFSFMRAGPLDMRMNPNDPVKAFDIIQTFSAAELLHLFYSYGEEPQAKRIVRAIIRAREQGQLRDSSQDFARLIEEALPHALRPQNKHPATRVFQALRIAVNHELSDLDAFLAKILPALRPLGRCAIISFHSLEDRKVKQTFAGWARSQVPRDVPLMHHQIRLPVCHVSAAIRPTEAECVANRRARSAVLRYCVKSEES